MTNGVGPVLMASSLGRTVVLAIREQHPDAQVLDRDAYLRVTVPQRCRLLRADVERLLQAPFHLPGDLERIMPSFQGRLHMTEDEATWEATP